MKPKSAEAAAKEYSETNHCDQIVREIACRRAFVAGHEAGHASRDEEVKALREALEKVYKGVERQIPKCHTGARMIDVCISDFHDRAHENYAKDPKNQRDYDLANLLDGAREVLAKYPGEGE